MLLALDPGFLPAKNNKANALANLGNLNGAILLYNEILEENPNYYTSDKQNLDTALLLKSEIPETSEVVSISKSEQLKFYKITNKTLSEKTLPEELISKENKNEMQPNFFEELTRHFFISVWFY